MVILYMMFVEYVAVLASQKMIVIVLVKNSIVITNVVVKVNLMNVVSVMDPELLYQNVIVKDNFLIVSKHVEEQFS